MTAKQTRPRREVRLPFTAEMLPHDEPQLLAEYRRAAWETYQRLPMPHRKMEAWRRTDIRGLRGETLRLPAPEAYRTLPPPPETLTRPLVDREHGGQMLLLPGGFHRTAQADLDAQGVIFTDLRTAAAEHPDLLAQVLGKIVPADDGKFAALAAAFAQNGVFVYVPRGVQVEAPLHSLAWGPGVGLAHIDHLVIWLDEGASLTYVHESASPDEEGQTLHVGLVEILLGDAARLHFVELQSWGRHVWNFTHERAQLGRDASIEWIFGSLGSRLTKSFTQVRLAAQGASARVSGFYFADGKQHLDHDTRQDHLAPHTTSDLLYKGALKDYSRSVWRGMIFVAPEAQKTDGYQANRNLLLSGTARADSIPGLEIKANDVRCTHGATIGKVDAEQMFYLQTRGVPKLDAERLIVEGFFDPIMQRIPFEGVRERFTRAIHEKMG